MISFTVDRQWFSHETIWSKRLGRAIDDENQTISVIEQPCDNKMIVSENQSNQKKTTEISFVLKILPQFNTTRKLSFDLIHESQTNSEQSSDQKDSHPTLITNILNYLKKNLCWHYKTQSNSV